MRHRILDSRDIPMKDIKVLTYLPAMKGKKFKACCGGSLWKSGGFVRFLSFRTKRELLCKVLIAVILGLSGCAQKTTPETVIMTSPPGAIITINGIESAQPSPFPYTFDFATNQQYRFIASKEGYFEEEFLVTEELVELQEGNITISLTRSPLWDATTFSPATNNWIQILASSELDARMAWQIMIDAVIKHSSNIKELNYESGYLQTRYTVRKFETKNGDFLLRSQIIATLVSTEPLIYRMKDVCEWSGNGIQWHPYNRIFLEHSEMIKEIQDRLRNI